MCVIALMQINELTHSGKGEEEEEKKIMQKILTLRVSLASR